MTDDFSAELEEIAKVVSAYPRGLSELRELIASLPAPSPLTLPGTTETKLPTTEEQTSQLSSGPVSAAGVASDTSMANPASISGGAIIPGTLQANAFASSIRPIQMIDGPDLPPLPDANFPDGAVVFNRDDGRIYRNDLEDWRTISPESGLGNHLVDPTFGTVDPDGSLVETTDTLLAGWIAKAAYAIGSPHADEKPYIYQVFDREAQDAPYSSAVVIMLSGSNTTALDESLGLAARTPAVGGWIDLPYVVASVQLSDWGVYYGVEGDYTNAEFSVELWRTGTPDVKLAETIVDIKTVPADFPVQVWIAYERPYPTADGNAYYPRFMFRTNKKATADYAEWQIALGEPMLHFAATPDPADFTPAIAKWIPESVKVWEGNELYPIIQLDRSGLRFGPPDVGTPSLDVRAYRTGTQTLTLDGNGVGPLTLKVDAIRVAVPSTSQTLTASTALLANAEFVRFTCSGSVATTAAPTIADGVDGQMLTILNVGTGTWTIYDQGTLASSNLRLTATGLAIGPRQSVKLIYSATVGDWVQIGPLVSVL